jgi:DNA polymerase III delta prime subunit
VDSDEGLSLAYETGQKLRAEIRETLVRNCSLRRKDFDAFASKVFSSIDTKKMEIENQRKLTREILKAYLGRQKELVTSLKEQLAKFSLEGSNRDSLELILSAIKTSQKEDGEQTFALLRDIQFRLKTFRQELADLNDNLQRILKRGELLKLEDLRQLQSALAHERRKAEKEVRKEDVSRLLAYFNRERQESIH